MYAVSREFSFSAAHRVEGHPKCGRLHGHNYKVTVEIYSNIIPSDGMLVDYGVMKEIVSPLIEAMDHRYLVSISNMNARDPYALMAISRGDAFELGTLASTAELIAHYLHDAVLEALRERFPADLDLEVGIDVQETEKTCGSYWS